MTDIVERLQKATLYEGHGELSALPEEAADEIASLRAENERLRAVLELYRDAVHIDVTMEGPKFMGANRSALKRAWDADLATLGDHNEKGY